MMTEDLRNFFEKIEVLGWPNKNKVILTLIRRFELISILFFTDTVIRRTRSHSHGAQWLNECWDQALAHSNPLCQLFKGSVCIFETGIRQCICISKGRCIR